MEMSSELIEVAGAKLAITEIGDARAGLNRLVWGHGWGQTGAVFTGMAETLKPFAPSSLIDFPGFGLSPNPPEDWGTADYADCVAEWIKASATQPVIWVGHSFGGRVGLQLGARYPELLTGMVLIAAAGLKRQRSLLEAVRFEGRKLAFQTAKRFTREGPQRDRLRQYFGSQDYRNAGALRPIMVRVIGEDLTEVAKAVRCPTLLLYGSNDTETPPEFGERFKALMPRSELAILHGFDHLSILTEGRHQVILRVRKFMESLGR